MMSQDKLLSHELVSALADGELGGDEFADALTALETSKDALAAWHGYHVVGDVLRSGDLGDARGDMAFLSRLRGRLALPVGLPSNDEAVVMDDFRAAHVLPDAAVATSNVLSSGSANDSSGRWKLMTGLASLVAVAVVGWHLSSVDAGPGAASQLAAAPSGSAALVASTAPTGPASMAGPTVMLRDARLDELLAAHKQFGGTSALQMPAGFLRNATFETSSR